MAASPRIVVGTSGWVYRDWRGPVYAPELPQRAWLQAYARRFATVEVNATFYRLPTEEAVDAWRRQVPAGFRFAVKASRYLTHIRRLRDPEAGLARFWALARRLGPSLGPVLVQLPPDLPADLPLLAAFLDAMPVGMRAAFEFRHPSWRRDATFELLDRSGAALVLADRPGSRVPEVVTGGWTYLRFHQGTIAGPGYRPEKLRRWARRIAAMPVSRGYVYFNNDPTGAAVRDAERLRRLLGPLAR